MQRCPGRGSGFSPAGARGQRRGEVTGPAPAGGSGGAERPSVRRVPGGPDAGAPGCTVFPPQVCGFTARPSAPSLTSPCSPRGWGSTVDARVPPSPTAHAYTSCSRTRASSPSLRLAVQAGGHPHPAQCRRLPAAPSLSSGSIFAPAHTPSLQHGLARPPRLASPLRSPHQGAGARLCVSVAPEIRMWILTLKLVVLGGGALGRGLAHEGAAPMNRIGVPGRPQTAPWPLHGARERVGRAFANQEAGPHQTPGSARLWMWDAQAPGPRQARVRRSQAPGLACAITPPAAAAETPADAELLRRAHAWGDLPAPRAPGLAPWPPLGPSLRTRQGRGRRLSPQEPRP